jgi:hypothetical protein
MHAGRPGVVQCASVEHRWHVVPTHAGPFALPTQCESVWHCTHIIVARLHARLFMGALTQSASDMQRSWQVLVLPIVMQTLGGVQ